MAGRYYKSNRSDIGRIELKLSNYLLLRWKRSLHHSSLGFVQLQFVKKIWVHIFGFWKNIDVIARGFFNLTSTTKSTLRFVFNYPHLKRDVTMWGKMKIRLTAMCVCLWPRNLKWVNRFGCGFLFERSYPSGGFSVCYFIKIGSSILTIDNLHNTRRN